MENMSVRFKNIVIKNWKNVRNGEVTFAEEKNSLLYNPSILGLYGQNGSGKTTLIQIIGIIKNLLMGQSLDKDLVDLVTQTENSSFIAVEFLVTNYLNKEYKVYYEIEFEKKFEDTDNTVFSKEQGKKLVIKKEKLSAALYIDSELVIRKNDLIVLNNDDNQIFLPDNKLKIMTNHSKDAQNELLISKKISYTSSKSFIFSSDTLKVFRNNCVENSYFEIIENLVNYANYNLFVIDTKDNGLINLNAALPFNFKTKDKSKRISLGHIALSLTSTTNIPKAAYEIVEKTISNLNIVLNEIIPGLQIKVEQTGIQYDEQGNELVQIHLLSIRNNIKISLGNESEGIKKLISILQILIVMYNNPSTTVAIDELDSGIFEYMLGELLRIISQSGKGQLIFSSHNLRPLETIDKKFVYFTTTNENNRYVKMLNVAKNNNLRDFYFHEILLGGQKEELYELTNNGAIALAFKEAGDSIE